MSTEALPRRTASTATTATDAAPLDADEVALSLAPFGESRMLPKAAYVDPAVLAWERRHVFADWVCVGRSGDVSEPRSAAAYSLGETGVLVTRDADGALHAFENACRHRGHELLPCGGSSQTRALTCPYHAWNYNHDGSLRSAPGFAKVATFDKSGRGLVGMPVEEWHGWLFVNPSGRAGDFATHVGALEGIVDRYDAGSLVTVRTHEYDVAANWKVVVENYQECYHCPQIHPELCRVSPPHSGANLEPEGDWVGGWMALRESAETMSLDGHSGGATMARLSDEEQRTVMYVAVMPNLLISLHPDYVMSHLLTPVTPDLTRIQCSWAFPPAATELAGFDPSYAVDFWDITNRQDWAACESVQRGIHTPGFVPGPMSPEEDGVYQFVTLMARRYLARPSADSA
ncbi:MAG: aromatic ring-hydroxylating oxygenase subunit alpha [Nocardioidaceae bacterium]